MKTPHFHRGAKACHLDGLITAEILGPGATEHPSLPLRRGCQTARVGVSHITLRPLTRAPISDKDDL